MKRFIELRFGQGDLGRSLIGKDKYNDELYVQRELIPVSAIVDAFVILPEKRNIQIRFKVGKREFCRTEYYRNTVDCIKRWVMLRKACGMTSGDVINNPPSLPMDVDEMEKYKVEKELKNAAEQVNEQEGKP